MTFTLSFPKIGNYGTSQPSGTHADKISTEKADFFGAVSTDTRYSRFYILYIVLSKFNGQIKRIWGGNCCW